ncbi:hypothetical protein [Acholeplasma palmae]|uniref:hypothetical protein n=1 Tax=Acholeplasma palmae TaxID=38986 RepID=UPI000B0DB56B|nr:hypothetical protein [Alteracholeplasma palmae]
MAKSKKPTVSKNKENQVEEKVYKSPTETWWGKTIIWLLIIGTIALIFVSAIIALINAI